jgi:hypothetical protein
MRQLYCKALHGIEDAKEKYLVAYNNGVCVAPPSKSHASQLHVFGRHRHSKKGGHSLWTHSLSCDSPHLLSSDLVLAGQNAHSIRRQSYPEPSLFMLIWQCRKWEYASSGICHLKAYSHWDKILKGMAKLKPSLSREMDTTKMKKP